MPIAIDLGATHIRIAKVVGLRISNKKIINTPKTKAKIKKALMGLVSKYKKDTICICIAAFLKNGKTIGTPNMDFANVNIKSLFKKSKVYVENDANCAGLAELTYGHGKNHKNFLLLTIGTGIGGAIIINKKLYKGSSYAGEIGHMIIKNKDLEKNISARNVALGILNTIYLLDPEIVILGGGRPKKHIKQIRAIVHKKDKIKGRKVKIIEAKLKDNAGLIGAALLPKQK